MTRNTRFCFFILVTSLCACVRWLRSFISWLLLFSCFCTCFYLSAWFHRSKRSQHNDYINICLPASKSFLFFDRKKSSVDFSSRPFVILALWCVRFFSSLSIELLWSLTTLTTFIVCFTVGLSLCPMHCTSEQHAHRHIDENHEIFLFCSVCFLLLLLLSFTLVSLLFICFLFGTKQVLKRTEIGDIDSLEWWTSSGEGSTSDFPPINNLCKTTMFTAIRQQDANRSEKHIRSISLVIGTFLLRWLVGSSTKMTTWYVSVPLYLPDLVERIRPESERAREREEGRQDTTARAIDHWFYSRDRQSRDSCARES